MVSATHVYIYREALLSDTTSYENEAVHKLVGQPRVIYVSMYATTSRRMPSRQHRRCLVRYRILM